MVGAVRLTLAATAAALAFASPAEAGPGPAPSEPKRSGPTAGDPCNDPDKLSFDPLLVDRMRRISEEVVHRRLRIGWHIYDGHSLR
jgi:hypothetical protein